MVSIDQSDPEKIEEGIYGIGGFLSVSSGKWMKMGGIMDGSVAGIGGMNCELDDFQALDENS